MPDRHVFHIAHAFTLGGLGAQHEWSLARARRDRAEYGSRVMPGGLGRLPSECRELLREGIEGGMGDRGPPETLKVVVIDCGDNVRTPERGSHHDRFPGRAFLHLAVAEYHVDDPIGLAAAFGQRHSHRHGKAVTKRTRRGLDAGVAIIRMAAEPAVGLAIIVQISPASSRITYWIMQPWPLDIKKVSGEEPSKLRRMSAWYMQSTISVHEYAEPMWSAPTCCEMSRIRRR